MGHGRGVAGRPRGNDPARGAVDDRRFLAGTDFRHERDPRPTRRISPGSTRPVRPLRNPDDLHEVMSGFGRTGRWFAVEHWGVVPDLITLAKGLPSSYLPPGAVGMRPHVP